MIISQIRNNKHVFQNVMDYRSIDGYAIENLNVFRDEDYKDRIFLKNENIFENIDSSDFQELLFLIKNNNSILEESLSYLYFLNFIKLFSYVKIIDTFKLGLKYDLLEIDLRKKLLITDIVANFRKFYSINFFLFLYRGNIDLFDNVGGYDPNNFNDSGLTKEEYFKFHENNFDDEFRKNVEKSNLYNMLLSRLQLSLKLRSNKKLKNKFLFGTRFRNYSFYSLKEDLNGIKKNKKIKDKFKLIKNKNKLKNYKFIQNINHKNNLKKKKININKKKIPSYKKFIKNLKNLKVFKEGVDNYNSLSRYFVIESLVDRIYKLNNNSFHDVKKKYSIKYIDSKYYRRYNKNKNYRYNNNKNKFNNNNKFKYNNNYKNNKFKNYNNNNNKLNYNNNYKNNKFKNNNNKNYNNNYNNKLNNYNNKNRFNNNNENKNNFKNYNKNENKLNNNKLNNKNKLNYNKNKLNYNKNKLNYKNNKLNKGEDNFNFDNYCNFFNRYNIKKNNNKSNENDKNKKINNKFFFYYFFYKELSLILYRNISKMEKKNIKMHFYAILEPTAAMFTRYIKKNLLKGSTLNQIIYPVLNRILRVYPNILGLQINISGRFTKRSRKSYMWYRRGPIQTAKRDSFVDFSKNNAILRYGLGGFRVWIYYHSIPKFVKLNSF